jgi:hypothetical protein
LAAPVEGVRSALEPGTLGVGAVAARVDMGFGPNVLGLGGQIVVGLGRVDLAAGINGLPCSGYFCAVNTVFYSVGGQVAVAAFGAGATRLSARATADIGTRGWDAFHMLAGAVQVSSGTSRHPVGWTDAAR